ncbi:MAG: hypothetical protein KDB64_10080 [Solirubrobacterales bacterium]|nr:hypothetical protein [Solirubrobacterales bacterium]MCB0862029.1 hypothetical protein [Solirubrobacterales bacterium]
MEGYWPILFMLIVLKVPAILMIYLLYWAAKNEPENGLIDEGDDSGGGRKRPRPLLPRGPRRGPHGGDALNPSSRRSRTAEPATGHRLLPGGRQAEPARAREREHTRS